MAVAIKAILLERNDQLGCGLTAIRTYANQAVDISSFEEAISDSTSSAVKACIIKDNKVYTVMKTFMDIDTNTRWVVAKNEMNGADRWPAG